MPPLSPLLHDISNGKKQAKSILIKDCQGISNALWRPLSPKYGYSLKWLWDCRTYTAKIWLHTCIKKQVINTWKGYKICFFKVSKSYKLNQCNTAKKGIGNQNVPCVTNRGKKTSVYGNMWGVQILKSKAVVFEAFCLSARLSACLRVGWFKNLSEAELTKLFW